MPGRAQTIVFFHAHPDDEAIFTGGTMALLAAAGWRVVLVLATAGEQGLTSALVGPEVPLAVRRMAETGRPAGSGQVLAPGAAPPAWSCSLGWSIAWSVCGLACGASGRRLRPALAKSPSCRGRCACPGRGSPPFSVRRGSPAAAPSARST